MTQATFLTLIAISNRCPTRKFDRKSFKPKGCAKNFSRIDNLLFSGVAS